MDDAPGTLVSRRHFLRGAGMLAGTLWLGSTALRALAPAEAWAATLTHFDDRAGRVLLVVTRHILPHATLDDAVDALVVKDLDDAAADARIAALLHAGIAALDAAAGGDWLALPAARRLELVTAASHTPFFDHLHRTALVALYNNELAFAHFGYGGNAALEGGYLRRGFDDLT